jgi:hypothetical protein
MFVDKYLFKSFIFSAKFSILLSKSLLGFGFDNSVESIFLLLFSLSFSSLFARISCLFSA